MFANIWADYKNRGFKADFPVTALHLMKHTGKWQTVKTFQFKVPPKDVIQPSLF
jgi:hypothetical protein